MESNAGGYVKKQIGMMHSMKPPKDWNFVSDKMLKPNGEIQKDKPNHKLNCSRQIESIE